MSFLKLKKIYLFLRYLLVLGIVFEGMFLPKSSFASPGLEFFHSLKNFLIKKPLRDNFPLTPEMREVIKLYTNSGFEGINWSLRHDQPNEHVPKLIDALQRLSKFEGLVFRTSTCFPDNKRREQLQKNLIIHDKAFLSTSKNSFLWEQSPCHMVIHCKSGVDISKLSSFPLEGEVLLLPKTPLRVLGEKSDGTILLEEVEAEREEAY